MMCFAGLWDCVKYEGHEEKLYTYTIITTSPNKQIGWLHDRMPVILDPGSDAVKTWLDPKRAEWSKELQSILKPFEGDLECFMVDKAVGKVGNNSPSFVVPIDSKDNKKNIANFFGAQKKAAKDEVEKKAVEQTETEMDKTDGAVKQEEDEKRDTTVKVEDPESNAPLPKPKDESEEKLAKGLKREIPDDDVEVEQAPVKLQKVEPSPQRTTQAGRKTRSATTNENRIKSPVKASDGSKKITSFFGK